MSIPFPIEPISEIPKSKKCLGGARPKGGYEFHTQENADRLVNVPLELFDTKNILFTSLSKNDLISVCKCFFNSIWATSKKHALRAQSLHRAYKEYIYTSLLQPREVIVGQVSEISSEFNAMQNESEKTKENVVEDGNPVGPLQNDIPGGFCCFERNIDPSSDGDNSWVEVLDLDKGCRETTKPIEQSELEQFSHKVKSRLFLTRAVCPIMICRNCI